MTFHEEIITNVFAKKSKNIKDNGIIDQKSFLKTIFDIKHK